MDPDADPDSAIFVSDLQDITKIIFFLVFLLNTFWRYIYIIFQKIKSHKEVTKQWEWMFFLYYFCLMIEGSGSVSLTNVSGSGRPYGSGSAKLTETNIIVSFIMMKCMESVINFRLFCLPLFIITSQLIKPSPFTSLWGGSVTVNLIFYENA